MVLAVSQDTINNQFFLLFAEGLIANTINIPYAQSNPSLVLNATMNAPTVGMVLNPPSPNQLDFNLNFASGTLTYTDPFGSDPTQVQTTDVSGWVITLLVNLSNMTINSASPAGLTVSSSAQSSLSSYVGNNAFSIQALFLSFDNVTLSQAVITAGGLQLQPSDPRFIPVLGALEQLIGSLKTSGNPYILGFHVASNNPQQTNQQIPALAPTGVEFLSNQYNYPAGSPSGDNSDDGLSALCYLAMTNNAQFPYPDGKVPAFTWNQIPAAAVQGRMFIDNNTFDTGYIQDLVLPVLLTALGGNGTWAANGDNSWALDYKSDDSDQNDGHGPVLGSWADINVYGVTSNEVNCAIALNVADSVSNQVVYSGSGFFFTKLDFYTHLFDIWDHACWVSTNYPFTFTLTLSAGADGTIDVAFTTTPGTPDPQSWSSWNFALGQAIAGFVDSSAKNQLTAQAALLETFQNAEFTSFTTSATQGFQALSEQLILPAPQQFYYSNIGLNSENDIVLDIGYKS